MHSVNSTTARLKRISATLAFLSCIFSIQAQDNSPYSRYGMGDIVPNQNITNRSMGGFVAGYSYDSSFLYAPLSSLNISNPASLGAMNSRSFSNVIFDLGVEVDRRTLRSNTSPAKYTSNNANLSYIQVGFPISTKRMESRGTFWGISFGLRPVTRINYKIESYSRLNGIDSIGNVYEGNGGLNQANISTGIRIKNFSFGVSSGYSFGNKDYSTRLEFINDSVLYYKGNSQTHTTFGGIFLNLGVQYNIRMGKGNLQLGAFSNLKQNISARRDNLNETFSYDNNGGVISIDTVSYKAGASGKLVLPASYTVGFVYNNSHWLTGLDFTTTQWKDYRYYDQPDLVKNNWRINAGAQYYAATETTPTNRYWKFVKYRAGFFYGPDYIDIGEKRNEYGITLGAGLPLTSFNLLRRGDFVVLNTGVEIGARGNKSSKSLRENVARFNVGISMNARWFQKPKYD